MRTRWTPRLLVRSLSEVHYGAIAFDAYPAEAYEKTKTIKPLQADVEQVVPGVLAYAGYLRRNIETDESGKSCADVCVCGFLTL